MANFADIADIEVFLQVAIDTDLKILSAEAALRDTSMAIRNYCRQLLDLVEDDVIILDSPGGTRLFLPELPVIEVSQVEEDGVILIPGDDYKLGQHGILHRVGRRWSAGVQNITITYSHGHATIPDDILVVCTRAASRGYQAGLKSAETDGTPGIASKQLGDFSVSFTAEGGASGEGVMGASAARMLLLSEKDLLNRFRI